MWRWRQVGGQAGRDCEGPWMVSYRIRILSRGHRNPSNVSEPENDAILSLRGSWSIFTRRWILASLSQQPLPRNSPSSPSVQPLTSISANDMEAQMLPPQLLSDTLPSVIFFIALTTFGNDLYGLVHFLFLCCPTECKQNGVREGWYLFCLLFHL